MVLKIGLDRLNQILNRSSKNHTNYWFNRKIVSLTNKNKKINLFFFSFFSDSLTIPVFKTMNMIQWRVVPCAYVLGYKLIAVN